MNKLIYYFYAILALSAANCCGMSLEEPVVLEKPLAICGRDLRLEYYNKKFTCHSCKDKPLCSYGDMRLYLHDEGKSLATMNIDIYECEAILKDKAKYLGLNNQNGALIYLNSFRVDDPFKNQGLGQRLFLYALQEIKQRYSKGLYYWIAGPDNGKKDDLYRFYTNCGGTKVPGDNSYFDIDLETLDLGIFTPKSKL